MEQLENRSLLATVGIGPTGLHVSEGGTATLQASLSQTQMQPVTVYYRTVAGTATENTDYTGITNQSVTIPPNATFANISVSALSDSSNEGAETFSVELLGASGATINPSASSTVVTIDNVEAAGGQGGGGTTTLTLSAPASVNEAEGFVLTVQLSTPGYYQINASINWGTTPGTGPTTFSGTTAADGSFTIGHQYFDDGPANGNGTPQDAETITFTGTATQYTMQGPVSTPLSGTTSITIHNVAPTPVFDIYNYMPIGGPWWVAAGTFQDVGLTDKGSLDIDWGDGSPHVTGTGLNVGSTFSQMHQYPPHGQSYTITITMTDDDTGTATYSETFQLYVFDLDNDANNNGVIDGDDECSEPPATGPGRYVSVNGDDDNEDGIPDMDEAGPIASEDDSEPFNIVWDGSMRPDINNYYGWHITLDVTHSEPDEYYMNPRVWLAPDKSGDQVNITDLPSPANAYGKQWTIGVDPIPSTLYLEARQAGGIGMRLRLWTPSWESAERYKPECSECSEEYDPPTGDPPWEYTIIFTAEESTVGLHIGNGITHEYVPENVKFTRGAFTVANMNDTDGDGIRDDNDTSVKNTIKGVEYKELDLMPFKIDKPAPYYPGDAGKRLKLTVKGGDYVRFWDEETKEH